MKESAGKERVKDDLKDYNGRTISLGMKLVDKWGEVGAVEHNNNRVHWVTKNGTYWLGTAIIEVWQLTIKEEK